MYLQQISLLNFKNYQEVEFFFSEKVNCLIGNNGTGKTNILDSIYYLTMSKSYFTSSDSQSIRHGSDFFVIQGNFVRSGINEEIYCGLKRNNRKIFKRNKKEYEKLSEHIGFLPIVMVSPSDNSIIHEGSEERRKLIDSVISQYNRQYLEHLIRYNRILLQRNTLLKEFNRGTPFNAELLDVYSEQLSLLGALIHSERIKFIDEFVPVFQKYYSIISGDNEKVDLSYQSQLNDNDMLSLLSSNSEKDRILEYTSVGIHKDDLQLNISGYPIKRLGSQGQQKTYVVAIKFAEFDFITKFNGVKPILLLDDIFDKFDSQRVEQIIKLVSNEQFGQIFITDTDLNRIEHILENHSGSHKVFRVEKDGIII